MKREKHEVLKKKKKKTVKTELIFRVILKKNKVTYTIIVRRILRYSEKKVSDVRPRFRSLKKKFGKTTFILEKKLRC